MTVYLDWNATNPPRASALVAWEIAQRDAWANPASIHRPGQQARSSLDAALASCARSLSCFADELVVTSGGTEALATVIRGALSDGGTALASATDHSAVLRNLPEGRARILPVDSEGRIEPTSFSGNDVRLVCIQGANNEVGTLHDVPRLAAAARAACPKAVLLLDACQLAGKEPFAMSAMGVDAAAIAGHKFGAPTGVGLLWLRRGVRLPPLIAGGRQQQDRRSGTEDAAMASAIAVALAEAVAALPSERPRQVALVELCMQRISSQLPDARRLASGAPRIANTLGLVHPRVDNRHLVVRLDLAGFAVSTGAACMAARGEASHVVLALGISEALARSFIRVSIGRGTTSDDMERFATAYVEAVRALV